MLSEEIKDYCEDIRKSVLNQIDFLGDISDGQLMELIDEEIKKRRDKGPSLKTRAQARQKVFNSLRGLDVLTELIEESDVTEIMVNGYKNIFYEKHGKLMRYPACFSSAEKYEDIIQSIAAGGNKTVNESSPLADTRLKDGSRVNIVLDPVSVGGSALTIRRFPKNPIGMTELIGMGSVSREIAGFLRIMVRSGMNIFISGGTGSGKTTFLNALSGYIPSDERVITIEDSAELQIAGVDNLVSLEARQTGMAGVEDITIRMLIRSALRMRPDRIIVGECRGGEALDMLQAMNTGHDGSLSTGHANSCEDMISRLETMVLMGAVDLPIQAIRAQIASGIDLLVHLGRLRDKSRRLLAIAEVDRDGDSVKLNMLYEFRETETSDSGASDKTGGMADRVTGEFVRCGTLNNRRKIAAAGLEEELERLQSL